MRQKRKLRRRRSYAPQRFSQRWKESGGYRLLKANKRMADFLTPAKSVASALKSIRVARRCSNCIVDISFTKDVWGLG
jgi:hypothetical protein